MDVAWLRKHLPQKALTVIWQISRQQLAGHWCGLSLFYLQSSNKVCRGQKAQWTAFNIDLNVSVHVRLPLHLLFYIATFRTEQCMYVTGTAMQSVLEVIISNWSFTLFLYVCSSVDFESLVSGLGQANHPNCCNLMPHSTPEAKHSGNLVKSLLIHVFLLVGVKGLSLRGNHELQHHCTKRQCFLVWNSRKFSTLYTTCFSMKVWNLKIAPLTRVLRVPSLQIIILQVCLLSLLEVYILYPSKSYCMNNHQGHGPASWFPPYVWVPRGHQYPSQKPHGREV